MTLKEYLSLKGVFLMEELGTYAWALTANDAINLLRLLKSSKITILGGDLLSLENDRYQYTGDGWSLMNIPDESSESYNERMFQLSLEKINLFESLTSETFRYVIVPQIKISDYDKTILVND